MITHQLQLPVHTPVTAPGDSSALLESARAKFGFVPNLLGMMATAPALLEGYMSLSIIFDKTSLTPTERQVVLLAVSAENGCAYCVAAHTAIAGMQEVPPDVIAALREGKAITDGRLEALRAFTIDVVGTRGWPRPEVVSRFVAAGFSSAQALEVVLGVGLKSLSNYANHLAGTPLDAAFASAKWSPPTNESSPCCAIK